MVGFGDIHVFIVIFLSGVLVPRLKWYLYPYYSIIECYLLPVLSIQTVLQ